MIKLALTATLALSTCTKAQSSCSVTTPICGEGSKLCPHNMCTKPDGKCNLDGDGCLDIRWNLDACLDPENTCGTGYCGTPPDFSDCFCDNGTCLTVGEKNTGSVPTVPSAVSTESSVEATSGASATEDSSITTATVTSESTILSTGVSTEVPGSTATPTSPIESTETVDINEVEEILTEATEPPSGNADASNEQDNGSYAMNGGLTLLFLFFGYAF